MTGKARAALGALDDELAKSAEIGNAPRDDQPPGPQLIGLALVHGYTTAFWWSAAIFASGAVICGTLLRRGPLTQAAVPQGAASRPA